MRKDDLRGALVGRGRATSLVPDISDQTAGSMTREFINIWKPSSAILVPLPVGAKTDRKDLLRSGIV